MPRLAPKGEINQEMLAIIVIVIAMALLAAVYLLLTGAFTRFLGDEVNSQLKLCETFQKVPIFGTIKC